MKREAPEANAEAERGGVSVVEQAVRASRFVDGCTPVLQPRGCTETETGIRSRLNSSEVVFVYLLVAAGSGQRAVQWAVQREAQAHHKRTTSARGARLRKRERAAANSRR